MLILIIIFCYIIIAVFTYTLLNELYILNEELLFILISTFWPITVPLWSIALFIFYFIIKPTNLYSKLFIKYLRGKING